MPNSNFQIIPLKEAAEGFGIQNISEFRNSMKKLGCLVKVAGLEFVNMTELDQKVSEGAQRAAEAVAQRSVESSEAQEIGLIRARQVKYPVWISNKERTIAEKEQAVETASNNFEKSQALKKVRSLKEDLQRMQDNQQRDEDRLEAILNMEIPELQAEAQ